MVTYVLISIFVVHFELHADGRKCNIPFFPMDFEVRKAMYKFLYCNLMSAFDALYAMFRLPLRLFKHYQQFVL